MAFALSFYLLPYPISRRSQSVFEQHCDGHRSNAAGNGGDGRGDGLDRCKVDVARQLAVLAAVHADVDDDRARLDHICGHEIGASDRDDQNIRLPRYPGTT